jgi:hypothetical protein
VEHEPDLPVSVGIEYQLPSDDSIQAVEDHGPALLMALSPAGAGLSATDAHTILHADKDGRREAMRLLAERGLRA